MPKYAAVRFRGKEMRVAYQPSFSTFASRRTQLFPRHLLVSCAPFLLPYVLRALI